MEQEKATHSGDLTPDTVEEITADHFHGPVTASSKGKERATDGYASPTGPCYLSNLPPELIDHILSFVSPLDLIAVSGACRDLYQIATNDRLWQAHVQAHVPGAHLSSPSPCASFRELYAAHELRWFLPRHKLWFCDRDLTGKLIVTRYDPRTGNIEGYQLLAISRHTTFQHWQMPGEEQDEEDDDVIMYSFEPELSLHIDRPVLRFEPTRHITQRDREHGRVDVTRIPVRNGVAVPEESSSSSPNNTAGPASRVAESHHFRAEMPIMLEPGYRTTSPHATFSNFVLARALAPERLRQRQGVDFPYGNIWPPPVIPADHRVAGSRTLGLQRPPLLEEDIPTRRSEVSDTAFRIRTWLEMTSGREGWRRFVAFGSEMLNENTDIGVTDLLNSMDHFRYTLTSTGDNLPTRLGPGSGQHIGVEITTYATLDSKWYTPTARYPYRGIWVGDYSGHGCEFLLIHQPDREDDDDHFDPELLPRREGETDEDYAQRKVDETAYRGSLKAIKLTGDPNVPRGEYTFVVDDLGPGGYVRTIQEAPFQGARVVKSKGHVAGTGFVNDKYIDAQLILTSHDRLAQYWIGMGHISFFQRVNIDDFIGV